MATDPTHIIQDDEKSDNSFSNQSKNHFNAYLVKNSRFIKKEIRDSRMIRSPRFDDFLIPNDQEDLVERLGKDHVLIEVFDSLIDEPKKVQELTALIVWKEEHLSGKTAELLEICSAEGIPFKEAMYSPNSEARKLANECENLGREIKELREQIEYVKNQSYQEKDWPELNLKFESGLLPVLPFESSFLPDPLYRYAADCAERIQCPIDFLAVGLLVSFSSLIGAGCAIFPLEYDDWGVVPNLWGGAVGTPGSKKTPALNSALTPLAVLEKEADKIFEEEKLKAEVEKVEREARKKSIKGRIEDAVKEENEQEIEAAKAALLYLEKEELTAQWKRYKTNDPTIEKLAELLADNPRGLLVFRDEIIGLLATLDKEGREDSRAFYLEGWNGYAPSPVKSDRIKRGTISCNPCISVLGGITPSKLRRYLGEAIQDISNDGFIQRFQALVYPDKLKEWKLIKRRRDDAAREEVIRIAKTLSEADFLALGAKIEGDFPLPVFRFTPEAQDFFNGWLGHLEKRFLDELEEGMFAEHLSKYRSFMPSLALISYLVRVVGGEPLSGVALKDAQRAAAFCDYFESHARRIYAITERPRIHAAKTLLRKIQDGSLNDGFSKRGVRRKEWSGLTTQDSVEEACEELIERGCLRREEVLPSSKGGPSTEIYYINPVLLKTLKGETDKTDKTEKEE